MRFIGGLLDKIIISLPLRNRRNGGLRSVVEKLEVVMTYEDGTKGYATYLPAEKDGRESCMMQDSHSDPRVRHRGWDEDHCPVCERWTSEPCCEIPAPAKAASVEAVD